MPITKLVHPQMTCAFYASTFVQDCPTFGDSDWCNIPQKTSIGQSEMRVQATHNGTTVYDYKGDMNASLDANWSGGDYGELVGSPRSL